MSTAARADVDTVVIGGGHNALVAGALLAEAGQKVLVVEQQDSPGGMAGMDVGVGGALVPRGSADLSLWRHQVSEQLDLEAHGLVLLDSPVTAFAPARDDLPAVTLYSAVERTVAALRPVAPADAAKWPSFVSWLAERSSELEPLLLQAPAIDQVATLARFPELLRVVSTPLREILDGWFESETLKGLLAQRSLFGSRFGPWSQGTGFGLVYHHYGITRERFAPIRRPRGGMASFVAALASSLEARGGECALRTTVESILVEQGRAVGVRVRDANGVREIRARQMISGADPSRTLLGLVGASRLPVAAVRQLRSVRYPGSVGRLDLLLEACPRFAGQTDDDDLTGQIMLAPSMSGLERAAECFARGRLPQSPPVISTLSQVEAGSCAGAYLLRVTVSPLAVDRAQRAALLASLLEMLEQASPGIGELVAERALLTASDFEAQWSLEGGDVHHGEMTLDQMFVLRPTPDAWGYRTPIENLYLCGAGTHPGGGVTGLPGRSAARYLMGSARLPGSA